MGKTGKVVECVIHCHVGGLFHGWNNDRRGIAFVSAKAIAAEIKTYRHRLVGADVHRRVICTHVGQIILSRRKYRDGYRHSRGGIARHGTIILRRDDVEIAALRIGSTVVGYNYKFLSPTVSGYGLLVDMVGTAPAATDVASRIPGVGDDHALPAHKHSHGFTGVYLCACKRIRTGSDKLYVLSLLQGEGAEMSTGSVGTV